MNRRGGVHRPPTLGVSPRGGLWDPVGVGAPSVSAVEG